MVAGDGPEREALRAPRAPPQVRFAGRVDDAALARLRDGRGGGARAVALADETFGLAAAEAMAAGLPVVASRVGALPELLGGDALVPPGDPRALAEAIGRVAGDRAAGRRGRERVRALCSPEAVAHGLARIYDGAGAPSA